MDPVSITQAIKWLYEASKILYGFIQDTRTVDRNLINLHRQVEGLAHVLEALGPAVEHQSARDVGAERQQLWKTVQEALNTCYPTVKELNQKLIAVTGEPENANALRQLKRTIKLNLSQGDIDRLLSAMQTHSINLQLALAIVQLVLTISTPETVVQEFSLRFGRLERMMMTVDERLATQTYPQPGLQPVDNTVNAVHFDDTTKRLLESAESVMTSASTATGRSVSGLTHRTTPALFASTFEHFDLPEASKSTLTEEHTTGAEEALPIGSLRWTQIQDWVHTSSTGLMQVPEAVEGSGSEPIPNESLLSTKSGMSISSDMHAGDPMLEIFDENSDEDDLDVQVIQNYFSRAEDKMQINEYAAAEMLLRRGLDDSKSLSPGKRLNLGLSEAQLHYATCCLHCGRFEDSEQIYMALTQEQIENVEGAVRQLHAFHGLAKLNLRKHNFEAASINCRQALQGRRRIKTIGKSHPDYSASLRLFALIHWAKGDKLRAETCSNLLPSKFKLNLEDFDRVLEAEYDITPTEGPGHRLCDVAPLAHFEQLDQITDSLNSTLDTRAGFTQFLSPYSRPKRPVISTEMVTPEPNKSKLSPLAAPGLSLQTASDISPQTSSNLSPPTPSSADSLLQRVPLLKEKTSNKSLVQAVMSGDVDLAHILCKGFGQKTKADVNTRAALGQTPLIMAASLQNISMCELLLRHHALVDEQDGVGSTALMSAASDGAFHICELLVLHGANLDLVDYNGVTALMKAAMNTRYSVCDLLLRSGSDIDVKDSEGCNVLEKATDDGIKSLIERYHRHPQYLSNYGQAGNALTLPPPYSDKEDQLTKGKRPPAIRLKILQQQRKRFCTFKALFWAIEEGYFTAVFMLLEKNPRDLEYRYTYDTEYSETVLHAVARKDRRDILSLLLGRGAPINIQDARKMTPLDVAALEGHMETAKILLKNGAWKDGVAIATTPLICAAGRKHHDICKLLINEGCNVNATDKSGKTALHFAVENGDNMLCELLCAKGIQADLQDKDGRTAFDAQGKTSISDK